MPEETGNSPKTGDVAAAEKVVLSENEWRQKLTPEQYHVLREKGTEAPGTGKYLNHDEQGNYTCAACGATLFKSDSKYESTMAIPQHNTNSQNAISVI